MQRKRVHVRATHTCGSELDRISCSEPCVVQQRLDVAEACVEPEVEALQAREPAHCTDVGDQGSREVEVRQTREPAQRANIADRVIDDCEGVQARESAQQVE